VSAYVVGKAHIDAILTTALEPRWPDSPSYWYEPNGERRNITQRTASDLGQKLLDENVRSVRYRYADGDLPGPLDASYRNPYTFTRGRVLTAPEMFLALDGLDYQACEHPEWETSEAYAIVQALRSWTWRGLPGYDEADTWEVRD
jgi:hypothetical protein